MKCGRTFRHRRRADNPSCDLHILLLERGHDILRRKISGYGLVGIEPYPHRIFARTEDIDITHPIEPCELVANLEERIIAGEKRIERSIRRHKVYDHRDVGRLLFRGHANALNVGRKHRNRDRHAILDQYLRGIEIGAEPEGDAQRHVAVAGALRRHVEHVLHAVDLLLDRRSHRFRHHLRVRARIIGRDLDRWRCDLGILRDGKRRERNDTHKGDDDTDHAGENWPVDEKVRKVHADRRCRSTVIFRSSIEGRFSLCPRRLRAPPREWAALSFPLAAIADA